MFSEVTREPRKAVELRLIASVEEVSDGLVRKTWCKGELALPLWKAEFLWYLPFYFVGAILATMAHTLSHRFGWGTSMFLVPIRH